MKKIIKSFTITLSVILTAFFGILIYYNHTLPDSFFVSLDTDFSICSNSLLTCSTNSKSVDTTVMKNISGDNQSVIKLLGVIPIKTVKLNSCPKKLLSPCGNPFGIKLLTQGVMVVGISDVSTPYGPKCPAKDSGIKIGDVIVSINGNTQIENGSVAKIIENSNGNTLNIVVSRDGQNIDISLTPVFCSDTDSYKSGMWVRDSTAGIGTVTYYDKDTGAFAGLGHPVCDIDTGNMLPILSGDVGPVTISGVIRGTSGSPGELVGNFTSNESLGTILYNTEAGVFGKLNFSPTENEAIPVAYKQEITVGKATILSTVYGDTPKEYEILIEKIDLDSDNLTKNMVIRITDDTLLSKSGGIVQGMSGSPIIQNGKLVGAVTHVFVNNPTMGYGIFCENMIDCSYNLNNNAA